MDQALSCPLCGDANDCGVALGKDTCWCFVTPVPPDVIDRVPDAARDRVCVCRKCAESLDVGAGIESTGG